MAEDSRNVNKKKQFLDGTHGDPAHVHPSPRYSKIQEEFLQLLDKVG